MTEDNEGLHRSQQRKQMKTEENVYLLKFVK